MKTTDNQSFTSLACKKLFRTLFHSPLQFISILLITILSATLFSGFISGAYTLKNQVDETFRLSNTADVVTSFSTLSIGYDGEMEYENIKKIVGDKGEVEKRNTNIVMLNGFSSCVSLVDTYPTISTDYYCTSSKEGDYFIIDYRYPTSPTMFGETWQNKDGSFKSFPISFSLEAIQRVLTDDVINTFSNSKFLKEGKENIFKSETLDLVFTPTGIMKNADNVSKATYYVPYNFLSKSLFNKVLIQTINENFTLPSEIPEDPLELVVYNIIDNPIENITNTFFLDNQFYTKLKDENLASQINKEVKDYFNSKEYNNILQSITKVDNDAYSLIYNDVKQTVLLANIFPSLFLFVSLLVTLTTFSQMILKDRKEIGILKAIGTPSKKITAYYLCLGLLITFLGVLLGTIFGVIFLPKALQIKFDALYFVASWTTNIPYIILIAFAVLVLVLTALVIYLIVRKETNLPPSFSLRPGVPKSVKSNAKKNKPNYSLVKYLYNNIDNLTKDEAKKAVENGQVMVENHVITDVKYKIIKDVDEIKYEGNVIYQKKTKDIFIPLKLAFRNMRCSISKCVMVIIGISGCVAILAGSFGVDDSINKGLTDDMRRFLSADVNLTISKLTDNTIKGLKQYVDSKEIERYETYNCVSSIIYSNNSPDVYNANVYVVEENTEFIYLDGLKMEGDGVIISQKLADPINVKQGDKVKFMVGEVVYESKVKAIFNTFYVHGLYICKSSYPTLASKVTGIYVKTNKELVKSNKEFAKKLKDIEGVSNYFEYERNFAILKETFDTISFLTFMMRIFAIALAIVVLYNFTILNYKLRFKDFVTMKVIGFSHYVVLLPFVFEIAILGLLGCSVGLGLAYPTTSLLLATNRNDMVYMTTYVYPKTYLFSFLLTITVLVVTLIILFIRNYFSKMSDSLKSYE